MDTIIPSLIWQDGWRKIELVCEHLDKPLSYDNLPGSNNSKKNCYTIVHFDGILQRYRQIVAL